MSSESEYADFRYDEPTGLIFKTSVDGSESVACYLNYDKRKRYWRRQIRWCGVVQNAHRVVWLLVHKSWPDGEIDHIDQDATNNRISNLRCVTHGENNKNKRLYATSSTGLSGVTLAKDGRYYVRIGVNGKQRRFGAYSTKEEAAEVALAAYESLGYHSNHGR